MRREDAANKFFAVRDAFGPDMPRGLPKPCAPQRAFAQAIAKIRTP